jgi:hypothetical protein
MSSPSLVYAACSASTTGGEKPPVTVPVSTTTSEPDETCRLAEGDPGEVVAALPALAG